MLKAEWEKRRALVEEGLVRELRTDEAFDARLAESMEYSLTAGGKRLRPILLMAAADANGMVGGQALDLASEGKRIDMDTLRRMHMAKTGALFRASVRSGAILGGADETQLAALTEYAEAFGLAFQITDDILDVTGDAAAIGKPVGSDERNHKSTYVTLTSLEEAKRLAREAADRAHEALAPLGGKAAFLDELAEYLVTRDR